MIKNCFIKKILMDVSKVYKKEDLESLIRL